MAEAGVGDIQSADAEMAATLPAGTLTFLLTDVEGSSRLWELDPKAASEAMARRQAIIRDATWRHNGTLPAEQGEGDSSVSAFARASDAAACAVDVQRALATEEWPKGVDVKVRIALHTGEAELRADGTYQGAALNRCARLRSLGHGGQILLSQATYEVLVDGLADGFALRDLGTYRLRDLTRPEHVWQLCHTQLADSFPPLRSLNAVANNLPVQLTSFVGRETEIDAVGALLGEHRLVTLTGAGGSGKTRLALQVAGRVGDEYPDGVWWIDLAPLADPSLVPAAVAAVLGVRESPLEPMADTVMRYLSTRRSLVTLDNCEHLIESCADLSARLVQGCPEITLIATSREPLRVDGENIWPVPPLSLSAADEADGSRPSSEAVRLFDDRARAARPKFVLNERNVQAIAQICARLDGIPLAIELAAARTRLLTVEQIADALEDRFHLLTGGARTALPRQRTLESSVDWSYDLLDEDERIVFRRLAVFAGSFTLEAAEAVCAGNGLEPEQVLDLLGGLVDRSLVQVADETGVQTRYRLLETIRDYARHKLTDAGEAEVTRDRHLDHYVSFAERAATGLEGPDLVGWLTRIDAELDNVRAAMDWSPHSADPNRGARIVGRLGLYWFARSELAVGRARLEAIVASPRVVGPDRADALTALCIIAYRAGDMTAGARHGDDAVAIARRLDDDSLLGPALHNRAWVRYWGEGDRFAAWTDFEEAATLLADSDHHAYRPLNLAVFGWSCADTSEIARAGTLLNEGLALTDRDLAPHARCYCLVSLGILGTIEGRFEEAARHLEEAIKLAGHIGDHYADSCARSFLTFVQVGRGRCEVGRELSERGLATAVKNRSPNCEGFMRWSLGWVELAEGKLDEAAADIDASYDLVGVAMPFMAAVCRAGQAHIALARGSWAEARRYADEALALGRQIDVVVAIVLALEALAMLARHERDAHAAEDLLHDALEAASRAGHRPMVCDTLDALVWALSDQGRLEEAARLLGASRILRDAINYVRPPAQRLSHDELVPQIRDALGAEAFDDAWADGTRLSLDAAVAYVRRGRGQRKRPTHGWNSLTPTELQVVELVTEGLTNPQIGERMFISKRTVQTHLARVFAKLGVSTRSELAATAAQRSGDR
jgi:predicted ATPase/class 3 adenylate cyclase/DNA-binding CsgD family transcriptional regulator